MSSILKQKLIEQAIQNEQTVLLQEGVHTPTKLDFIKSAVEGDLVAFRIYFESQQGTKLTKVISGKVLENDNEKEVMVLQTRNGLEYAAPYSLVMWKKVGQRWSRGIYEEMRLGAVPVDPNDENFSVVGALGSSDEINKIHYFDEQ